MIARIRGSAFPPTLRGPLLIDQGGMPRYWVLVWTSFLPSDMAESTLVRLLGYVDAFYRYVDPIFGTGRLDDAIGLQDLNLLGEMFEGYFHSIKNRGGGPSEAGAGWHAAVRFVREILTWITKAADSKYRLHELEARLSRFEMLYSQLRPSRRRKVEPMRSYTQSLVNLLYETLYPESKNNPFARPTTRWRAYVIFVAFLFLGLRRGELLILLANAVEHEWDRESGVTTFYIRVGAENEDDPRHSRPSIKTAPSIRRIPVGPFVKDAIFEYKTSYRGRPGHPFLMNSYRNRPLSTEGVSEIFHRITAALPASALKDLQRRTGDRSVTPHGSATLRLWLCSRRSDQ